MFLRIMTEIFLFHSLVILINHAQPESASTESTVLRNELSQLLSNENHLPFEFCLEVLFAYEMHDEVFSLLIYKSGFEQLLGILRREVDSAV